MTNFNSGDWVGRDKVEGDVYVQGGSGNTFNVTRNDGGADVAAAVKELRVFIAELTRSGAVADDGTVTNPGAVVRAVESNRGRLQALGAAVSGGAKEAVLKVVQGGVAALVVALLGGSV